MYASKLASIIVFGSAIMQRRNVAVSDTAVVQSCLEADVRAELDRITSNTAFQASDRRRAFLRYVVDEALAGHAHRLKGYAIAVAVLGRDETFDPQTDPVVRLEARRLRRDLDCYYGSAGRASQVRISIPKGSYVPHFEYQHYEAEDASPSPARDESPASNAGEEQIARALTVPDVATTAATALRYWGLASALSLLAVIAAVYWYGSKANAPTAASDEQRRPAVVVLPFKVLGSTQYSQHVAGGISQELVGALMRFSNLRLFTSSVNSKANVLDGAAGLGRDFNVAYVVSGTVADSEREVRVSAQMSNARTGEVLWAEAFHEPLTPKALMKMQRDLAGKIATALGQPYGVVNSAVDVMRTMPHVSNMQSYVCVLRAYDYRRDFARAKYAPVLRCLQETVARDPDYSDAWAMLGWIHVDAGRIHYIEEAQRKGEYEKALAAASRAISLAPNSALALKVLGTVYHYLGRYDESERVTRQALALNPNDPEALAQLGWRLAVRERFAEGIPILKRAISRTMNPPGWYYHLVAIDLFLKGDIEQMRHAVQQSMTSSGGFSELLRAVCAGAIGDRETARAALEALSNYKTLAEDPAGFMRRHGATEKIVQALMKGLTDARRIASQP